MKKIIVMVLCLVLALSMVGCGAKKESEEHTLKGTITEIKEQTMLVQGKDENDIYSVAIKNMPASPEPKVGYEVEIVYSGPILETYPASFNKVISVKIISE